MEGFKKGREPGLMCRLLSDIDIGPVGDWQRNAAVILRIVRGRTTIELDNSPVNVCSIRRSNKI
jgi:hypothetical protein